MSLALNAATADALSKVLLSTHTVEEGQVPWFDWSQKEATSVIDPASSPPVPEQYLGFNQFVSPANALALDSQHIQPRNFGQSQFVSPGVAPALNPQPLPPGGAGSPVQTFAADDWCGTGRPFPPHPPGPWADVVATALAFR